MLSQYKKKVDRSQSAIIAAMRKMGAAVHVLSLGNDFPDLLVGWRGAWRLIEVKEVATVSDPDGGHFSRGQLHFLRDAKGHVDIVTGEEDAIVSLKMGRRVTDEEQGRLALWLIQNSQETVRVKKLLGVLGR